MDAVTITRHQTATSGEYHAHVPGSSLIGRLTWVAHDTIRHADHTLVPPELGGRGIAAQLVEALISDAREHNFRIHPACSYVSAAFAKHPEWADLLA